METFIGDVARILRAVRRGSKSEYADIITANGILVRIRLADHNVKVSNYDNAGINNGISIVISRKPNENITNDGDAHLVEFFYSDKKISKSDGKPLVEILKSIKQALYSGEYKDNTGLAVREEVNIPEFHRVYHGSGAKFDRFDHSFMGTGEGAQVFGWGTYVTEVEGIGKSYAGVGVTKLGHLQAKLGNVDSAISLLEKEVQKAEKDLTSDNETVRRIATYTLETASERRKALEEEKATVEEEMKSYRNLYSVEIPDDNGSNYLYWEKPVNGEIQERVANGLQSIGFEFEPEMNHLAYSRDGKIAVLNINAKGKDLYAELSEALGGDKAASQFLNDLGFVGISYPAEAMTGGREDGARNYVIFNENDAQITDRVEFLRTANGTVYGWTVNGRIYLAPDGINPNTPVHEYTHLWASAIEQRDPKMWRKIVEAMKQSPVWNEVMADEAYRDIWNDDNRVTSEVLARLTGNENYRRTMHEAAVKENDPTKKFGLIAALGRVKRALTDFWNTVKGWFGADNAMPWERFVSSAIGDFYKGVNPNVKSSPMERIFVGENLGESAMGTEKKSSFSERSGVIPGNSSSKRLLQAGNGHLSTNSLTSQEDVAKLVKNTQNTIRSANKKINEGGLNNLRTVENAVRKVSETLKLVKAKSTQSFYGDLYEGDFLVGGKSLHLRISTHPATGERMGNHSADDKISIVIYKNGEHISREEHDGYTEYTYYPEEVSLEDASNAIIKGILNLVNNGEFVDEIGKAHRQDYPFVNEDNDIRFRSVGGNSGYVGYSMSKRAAQAREEGRFPKTDFKKEYNMPQRTLDALVSAGIIDNSEWHHTSKMGNRTTFYGWDLDDYADIYAENKKEIDELAKGEKPKNPYKLMKLNIPEGYWEVRRSLENEELSYEEVSKAMAERFPEVAAASENNRLYHEAEAEAAKGQQGVNKRLQDFFDNKLNEAAERVDNEITEAVNNLAAELHTDVEIVKEGDVRYRTSEEIETEYPNWLEGTTTDSGKHSTQVEGTRKTYKKVADWIEENMGMDVDILDASSGMGYGTADLRERGFNIEDVEPYQSEDRKQNNPATYSSYADIEKQYDYIISNAVLNVIPDDWRAGVLHDMADKLKAGGKIFINTRKAGEEKFIKDKIELDSPQEVLVKRNGKIASYQRFFTPQELKEWINRELGAGYTVEIANERNSGTKGLAAVVVTKNNESPAKGKTSGLGQPISNHKGMADAPIANVTAKIGKNAERANRLNAIISSIEEIGEMGPHEFLHEVVNAMLLNNNVSTDVSRYAKLGGGVTLRLADHYGNASNFKEHKDLTDNFGLVIKLSDKRFKSDDDVDYLEYVYFPDKLIKERQIEIAKGLKAFMETGRYELLPMPDKVNPSGKFRDRNYRDGEGTYTDEEINFANDPVSKVLGKPRGTKKKLREFAALNPNALYFVNFYKSYGAVSKF